MSWYRFGHIGLAMLAALVPDEGRADPFVPDSEAVVLERLPAAGDDLARDLRDQRAALAQNPDDLDIALSLATGYVRLGRREADPRYDGYAQAALAPWWNLASPPIPVLLLRATLAQRRHDFAGALADLERVLAQRAASPPGLAQQGDHPRRSRASRLRRKGSCAQLAGTRREPDRSGLRRRGLRMGRTCARRLSRAPGRVEPIAGRGARDPGLGADHPRGARDAAGRCDRRREALSRRARPRVARSVSARRLRRFPARRGSSG